MLKGKGQNEFWGLQRTALRIPLTAAKHAVLKRVIEVFEGTFVNSNSEAKGLYGNKDIFWAVFLLRDRKKGPVPRPLKVIGVSGGAILHKTVIHFNNWPINYCFV